MVGGASGALVLMGLVWFVMASDELSEPPAPASSSGLILTGTLHVESRKLTLRSADALLLDCPLATCGFPGVAAYGGRKVTVSVAGARIVEFRAADKTIDARALRLEAAAGRRSTGLVALSIGLLLAPLAWRWRGRPLRRNK